MKTNTDEVSMVTLKASKRLTGVMVTLSALIVLSGCVSSGPELSSGRGVQSGGVVVIPIAAANKSEQPIPLGKVEYTVVVDGGTPVVVTRSAQVTVHALSTQVIELPVPAAPGAQKYSITGELVYVPTRKFWKVMYDEEIYRPGVSFAFQGEIDQAALTPTAAQPANPSSVDNQTPSGASDVKSTEK